MLKQLSLSIFITMFFVLLGAQQSYGQSTKENQLISSFFLEKNVKKKHSRLMALGEYYKVNNIQKADSIRHIILDKSINFEDSIRFNALFYSAEITLLIGDQDDYFKSILACQPFLNKLNSDDVQFKLFRHLGYYHSSMQEFQTADFYLKLAIKLAEKERNNQKLSEAYSYLSLNFMSANMKDSALNFSNKSINFARREKDKAVLARAFNNQAKVYDYFGQIELSVAKNLVSLQLAEEVQNILLLSKFTREIGQEQKIILNLDDAEYYFKRSLNYAKQIYDRSQMALALSNLAGVNLERNNLKVANQNANLAINYLIPLNDFNGLGEAHNILGMVYQKQGNFNLASSNFNQSLVYYEATSNKEKIAGVYHNVGTIFKEEKKYSNALNYLNRSIQIRVEYGSKNQIYKTYRVIADLYKEINNPTKSLEYMELYINYLDSNMTIQAATKIAELSESYRSEQRERLINAQSDSLRRQQQEKVLTSTKLENSQLRNNFQMYIILAFMIIIVLAGVIIFYRWNNSKIIQQQREVEMSQTLLRTQMNPHFVFNAMSVIQSYIFENDTVNSSKFLVNFSRLMRLILENSPKEFIPISTEVEILEKYLVMQKLRFEDRFQFDIHTDDILFEEGALIPPMITQPFIENAIEHGQLHTIDGGFIKISFVKYNTMLVITIIDNGIGRKGARLKQQSSAHKSMAMDITSERIKNLNKKYKSDGSMVLEDYDKTLETGTKVVISLPYTIDTNK